MLLSPFDQFNVSMANQSIINKSYRPETPCICSKAL